MRKIRTFVLCFILLAIIWPTNSVCASTMLTHEDKQTYNLPQPDAMPALPLPQTALPIKAPTSRNASPTNPLVYGIDVSRYQEQINWQMVSTDPNVKFAYVKATESSGHVDRFYRRNIAEARRFGIPVGAYHFFSPNASVATQLQNFTDQIDLAHHDLIPVVDVEHRGRSSAASFHRKLSAFLREIERLYGIRPIIYTGVNFYNEHLAGRYTQYKFWIARYADMPPTLVDNVPIVMWQFTSTGFVNGIKGEVDRNCLLDEYGMTDILLPIKRSQTTNNAL